ncbi:MAG TPA: hypothetical protein VMW47_13620 [Verrucomicrobiae bacterium]|nr:hypothetical protein [Verrucomicrobiae bacterium]
MAVPASAHPGRDDVATTSPPAASDPRPPCPVCATPFTRVRRQRYCSTACRQTAWRRIHRPPLPVVAVPPRQRRRPITVYVCPDCEERYLGEQWCPDCQRPCRRIGFGGACPACDHPVALEDLLAPTLLAAIPPSARAGDGPAAASPLIPNRRTPL